MARSRIRDPENVREARRGRDRARKKIRADGDSRSMHDLYQSDLDRHFWAWGKKRARRRRGTKRRRRRLAKLVASAAGALGAAGLSYFLLKRRHRDERPDDPEAAQGMSDEG